MPQPEQAPPLDDLKQWIDEATSAVEDSLNFAGRRIKLCVRIGQALASWKRRVGHGKWVTWLQENMRQVTYETARKWMKLGEDVRTGRLDLTNAKSVRHAYQLANILPESPGGASVHGEKPISYVVHADRLEAVLKDMNVAELSRAEREQLRLRLQPIAEFYHRLEA